jgi:hypothetical protein
VDGCNWIGQLSLAGAQTKALVLRKGVRKPRQEGETSRDSDALIPQLVRSRPLQNISAAATTQWRPNEPMPALN